MQQALYRKYRPKTFEDVVGQEQVTSVLKNEIRENRPAHAYLFTGSRGTGKTSCSKILAKAVNCLNPHDGNPCCECEICQGIENGSILDVVEIDAASNNSVDDVRELRDEAEYTPAMCKYRVYIIDEVHMLSTNAFNALLKIMEEPPPHVIFVLATTEVHKIPATILSRCQSFDFKRITENDIYSLLARVAENEEFILDEQGGMLIANLAKGALRDALSILDVCSSANEPITSDVVSRLTGLAGNEHISKIVDMLIDLDCGGVLNAFDIAYENSVEPQRLCQQMVEYLRELMLCISVSNPEKYVSGGRNTQHMVEQAKKMGIAKILSALKEMQTALDLMSSTTMRALQLEMGVMRLCFLEENLKSDDNVSKRIDMLETKLNKIISDGIKFSSQNPQSANDNITKSAPTLENQVVNVKESMKKNATPLKEWADVIANLEKVNGALYGSLINSKAYISDDVLLVECENELFLSLVRENEYARNSLRKATLDVTGKKFKLGPFKKDMYTISEKTDPLDDFINKLDTSSEEIELK
ncbi:MAG: DNA polymerase III subunit gamma/tau [Oscillospiraceae bacterium]